MGINDARRIVAFVDTWGQSFSRLADELGMSENEARLAYARAKSACNVADAREAVRKLNELAASFNLTAADMLAVYG